MARGIKIRKEAFRVYLDEVEMEVEVPIDPLDVESEMTSEMQKVIRAFVLEPGEQPPGGGSVFLLRLPPLKRLIKLGNQARTGEAAEALIDAVKDALTGWEGIRDEEGTDVEFDVELVDHLAFDEVNALATFLIEQMNISTSKETVGNV